MTSQGDGAAEIGVYFGLKRGPCQLLHVLTCGAEPKIREPCTIDKRLVWDVIWATSCFLAVQLSQLTQKCSQHSSEEEDDVGAQWSNFGLASFQVQIDQTLKRSCRWDVKDVFSVFTYNIQAAQHSLPVRI